MKCQTIKKDDTVRIVNAIDVSGNKFVPMYVNYKVINIYDDVVVDIGIGNIVKHTLKKENVKLESPSS